jgi:hypothetical protein
MASTPFSMAFKTAWLSFIQQQHPTHYVTLSWNRKVSLPRMRRDLRNLMHKVDRRLLGSRFHKYPKEARTRAWFMIEGLDIYHAHVHAAWIFPKRTLRDYLRVNRLFAQGVWQEIVPSGSHKLDMDAYKGFKDTAQGYCFKGLNPFSDPEMLMCSDDFIRS